MIKVLHTADWHIGTFEGPEVDGVNLRSEDTINCLNEVVRVTTEEKPELVLVSGDIFHKAEVWQGRSHKEVLQARSIILKLAEVAKKVVVMRGTPNHDSSEAFEELAAHFEFVDKVDIVTTPQVVRTPDFDIAVLPGFDRGVFRAKYPGISKEDENEVFTKELSNIVLGLKAQCDGSKATIFMSHYTVPGCNTESGQTMMLTQFEPILTQDTLNAADFDLVALGHIHRPQAIQGVKNCFYSGAVNAMNFNDEGQERGFYIHEFAPDYVKNKVNYANSVFRKTPYREFITIRFTDTDITAINLGHLDEVAMNFWRYNGAVAGKIVRVLYTCSYENSKAINKTAIQNALLEDGAFYVKDILPEKIATVADRTNMSDTTDPETNLRKYLEEKEYPEEKIQELILKARPIIAEAEASMSMTAATGTFEPVEIAVKNYRNYEEETFSFEDISFCTINGQNGAGKSSLFMDAIVDCLYEKPREGGKTSVKVPWLRSDEKARSGSISFTFRIGEKTYRVVRTRTKSGKPTLNLSELVNGEWENRSKERVDDTQEEIINTIGMDSTMFKSCALIMQDQYGLFLEAPAEERMLILSNLLGLGVYQAMEKITWDKAKIHGAKSRDIKQEMNIHEATIAEFGNPEEKLSILEESLAEYEKLLKDKTSERDVHKVRLTHQQEAAARWNKLLVSIKTLEAKKTATEENRTSQQAIIDSSSLILAEKEEIEAKVAERNDLLKRELELAGQSALHTSKKQEAENFAKQADSEQKTITEMQNDVQVKRNEMNVLILDSANDGEVRQKVEDYNQKKAELEKMQEKAVEYQKAKTEYSAAVFHHDETKRKFEAEKAKADEQKKVLEQKVGILNESGCVDIDNAHCKFLQDAIEAKEKLSTHEALYVDISAREECEIKKTKQVVDEKYEEMQAIAFDAAALTILQNECATLLPYVSQLEVINQRENRIGLIKTELEHLQSNISEAEKRLAEVKLKGAQAETERDVYAKAFEEHVQVLSSITALEPWVEKEKQLPVAEERKITAMSRILELTTELSGIDTELAEKRVELETESQAINGIEELTAIVTNLNVEIDNINEAIKSVQLEMGGLQQKLEQIEKLKNEIAELQKKKNQAAKEVADYEILKISFSQDGIPHQIIRSVIPQLTSISNNILGQMTGGKMGIEFKTEKGLKSNSKKEVVTLDIFIEEYGKSSLPYLSKSGGEKVKSSLSVILALAEIKSISAGVQLGMLFIDEPPFLDGEGIQAYCDALETIQSRYENMKIMAITHDPTMKARFPQSLDVIKTESGSKVIY